MNTEQELVADWVRDIQEMHVKYKVHKWAEENPEKLWDFLQFRLNFLDEELQETWKGYDERKPEEVVDGLIDLVVIAISTMDVLGVCPYTAWDAVHRANMDKESGVNPTRENPLNLPDMVKPTMETHGREWQPPSHEGNYGGLT